MKFEITTTIDSSMLRLAAMSMSHKEAVEMLCAIDLGIADAGFTEMLIKRLAKSLKDDIGSSVDEVDLPFIDWSKV